MSLLVIGLICWSAILVFVIAMLRAAAVADRAAGRQAGEHGGDGRRPDTDDVRGNEPAQRTRRLEPASLTPWLAGAVALVLAALTAHALGASAADTVLAIAGGACACAAGAMIERGRRRRLLARQARDLSVQRAAILGLSLRLLELRDPAAARHAAAVAHYSRLLARAAGGSERQQQIAHWAGLLHDIGRQRFPDPLLTTRGRLSDADWRAIHQHPLTGAALLETVPGLDEVATAVQAHHEHVDGTGYPHGLHGEQIPHTARIVAIAEAYDVLSASDSYRDGGDPDRAARELRRVAGTQLDPRLVELFLITVSPRRHRPTLDDELATPWASVELTLGSPPDR